MRGAVKAAPAEENFDSSRRRAGGSVGTEVTRARQMQQEHQYRGAVKHLPPDMTLSDVLAAHLESGYRIGATNLYLEFLSTLTDVGVAPAALPALPQSSVGMLITRFLWRNLVSQRWQLSTASSYLEQLCSCLHKDRGISLRGSCQHMQTPLRAIGPPNNRSSSSQ